MSEFPTKPGLYWVREKQDPDWMIASVKGVSPFFRVRVWNPDNNYVGEAKHPESFEWGAEVPLVHTPAVFSCEAPGTLPHAIQVGMDIHRWGVRL